METKLESPIQVSPRAVSRVSLHRTSARMKKRQGEEKEVVGELSGNIQGEEWF